jgi:hypothetical protein
MRAYVMIAVLILSATSFALTSVADDDSVTMPIGSSKNVVMSFHSNINDTVIMSISGEKPWMLLSQSKFDIGKNQTKNISLIISPKSDTIPGVYKVSVVGQSFKTKEKASNDVFISVTKEQGVYAERILVKGNLKPTGNIEVKFEVKNFGEVTVSNSMMKMTLKSPSSTVFQEEEKLASIDPDEILTVTKIITLPNNAVPGSYIVTAEVFSNDKEFKLDQTFSVEKTPVIEKEISPVRLLIGSGKKITFINEGNDKGIYRHEEAISGFDSMFFIGNPTKIENNVYTWTGEIDPGQEVSVEYKIDYIPLTLVLLALIGAYWYITKKVMVVGIRKFVMQKKIISEGSEFTVGVEIKNSAGREITNITVRDFAPTVFSVKDAQGVRPDKKKTSYGTTLTWHVDRLKNGEERLFSYKIAPVFGVGGKMEIPAATVSYRQGEEVVENRSVAPSLGVITKKRE